MFAGIELERDRAYRRLVELIFAGEVGLDTNLSERRLCDALQMGRMPIREALQQLEREGLVEIRPARGTFVRQFDLDDLRGVYEVREALECLAARLAARHGLTSGLRASSLLMRDMLAQPGRYTSIEIDDAGTACHDAIYAAAGNRALTETFQPLRLRARLAFGLPRFFDAAEQADGLAEHLAILGAIERRRPGQAADLMRDHLANGLALRIRLSEGRRAQDAAGPERAGTPPRRANSRGVR